MQSLVSQKNREAIVTPLFRVFFIWTISYVLVENTLKLVIKNRLIKASPVSSRPSNMKPRKPPKIIPFFNASISSLIKDIEKLTTINANDPIAMRGRTL